MAVRAGEDDAVGESDRRLREIVIEHRRVVARAAVEQIAAEAAVDGVVAGVPVVGLGFRGAVERIVPARAVDRPVDDHQLQLAALDDLGASERIVRLGVEQVDELAGQVEQRGDVEHAG